MVRRPGDGLDQFRRDGRGERVTGEALGQGAPVDELHRQIRPGRVGAEGRWGEDFAVVGRDGSIHLPTEVLTTFEPGTLVRVFLERDGTARLVPASLEGHQ